MPKSAIDGHLECATLQVPIDHGDPASDTIPIAVARRPASRGPAEGVIVVNPGGPGGSGVDSVATDGGSVPEELRARYDIVGFDPRGSNRSGAIVCVDDQTFRAYVDTVDPTPDDAAELTDYQDGVSSFESSCAERHGNLLPYVGTRFVARDVDLLRDALGVEQITWFGYSYGTLMGTVYAQEFPERVHALVLDGPVVTGVPLAEQARIDIEGLQRGFERFADACDARGDDCPFTSHGGTRAALDAVVARVLQGDLDGYYEVQGYEAPTATPGDWGLTEGRLGYSLIVAVYSESSWPLLEAALAEVLEDDTASQLRYLSDVYLSGFKPPPFTTTGEQTFWSLRCADRDADEEVATVEEGFEREREELGDLYSGRPAFITGWRIPNVWCLDGVWPEPAERLGDAEIEAGDAPPAIVFGATGDFATPIEYADLLGQRLGGAHVVRVEASSHVNIGRNDCEADLAVAFVLDPTRPPARTTC